MAVLSQAKKPNFVSVNAIQFECKREWKEKKNEIKSKMKFKKINKWN